MDSEEKDSYLTRKRGYGQGELRVGRHLILGEDIYSLSFVAQLEFNNVIEPFFDIMKGTLKMQAL